MASTNKTSHLQLNQWVGTDKPTRLDYVQDNQKIDTAMSNHENNTELHFTTEEKEKIQNPRTSYYSGDGAESRTITLSYAPKVIIVYKKNAATHEYMSTYQKVNWCLGVLGNGYTGGLSISGKTITVKQTSTTDSYGLRYNLNENGAQYAIIGIV